MIKHTQVVVVPSFPTGHWAGDSIEAMLLAENPRRTNALGKLDEHATN